MSHRTPSTCAIVCLLLQACNVPLPKGSHGVHLADAGEGAHDHDGAAPDGAAPVCARAVVVAESDYTSTNVALLGLDGTVLAPSVASSATRHVGLTAPLSGDIVLPTTPVAGSELVLIDGALASSRLIWVDVETAAKRELSVATGFWSDPHDYAAISASKAYVSRYDTNTSPGKQPFDSGGDLLIVDPRGPAILGSIDLTGTLGDDVAQVLPDVDKIVVSGERAYVLLGALPRDFSTTQAPSRLVVMDTSKDELVAAIALDGLFDCAGLALSPDGRHIAVFCSGGKIDPTARSNLSGSGVALVETGDEPQVVKRFDAADIGQGPVGFFGAFTSASTLLVQVFGYDDPATGNSFDDVIVALDVDSGKTTTVLRSAGEPFTLGGIACDLDCGACFIADAKREGGVVHRYAIGDGGALTGDQGIKVETDPGLPPRYVSLFR